MRKTIIPLPPISDQLRIVAELDRLETEVATIKELQAETAEELDSLLTTILGRTFRGNL